MITISFKLEEEFIANNASEETIDAKMKEAKGDKAFRVLFNSIAFKQLQKQIEAGKTEFVVTPDKLDDKSMIMYNNELGDICMLAFLSETDKKNESED